MMAIEIYSDKFSNPELAQIQQKFIVIKFPAPKKKVLQPWLKWPRKVKVINFPALGKMTTESYSDKFSSPGPNSCQLLFASVQLR